MDPLAAAMQRTGFLLTSLPAGHPDAWLVSAGNFISISLIVAFTWLYSATGGLRSVVATDVVQLAVMLAAMTLASLSLFSLLVGLGQWMVGAPHGGRRFSPAASSSSDWPSFLPGGGSAASPTNL
jgi:Na+/proline symporter